MSHTDTPSQPLPQAPPAASVATRVRIDLIKSHYALTPQPMWAGMVFCFVLAWAVAPNVGWLAALAWLAVKLATATVRLLEDARFKRDPAQVEHIERWYQRYWSLALIDGLGWGAVGVLFLPSNDAAMDGMMVGVVAGVAAVGVFTLIGNLKVSAAFVVTAVLPTALALMVQNTRAGWVGAVGLLIYMLVVIGEAYRGAKLFTELSRLRHENEWIAEQRQRALELAQQNSAAKSRFLATVSHEVRTPLNGILGMAQLVLGADLPAVQRQQVQVLTQSARHLRDLIDDILDMSRIESGRLRVEAAPFHLQNTVQEVADILAPMAKTKGLTFGVTYAPDLATRWHADAARIRQVLHNLLGNAIKFTASGEVGLAVTQREAGLCFLVFDTGPGIPAQDLVRIFEPFEQASSGTQLQRSGTGLGLPIARQLAQAMGGDVCCAATSDAGSTFLFEITAPALPEQPTPAPAAADAPSPGPMPAAPLLLVEDNAVNALVAMAMLERLGYAAEHVENGEEALAALAGKTYALVLMDCQMPVMDGFEATRQWRALETQEKARGHLPIVAVTANAAEGDRERCLKAGMDDYLAKPFELDSLNTMLTRYVVKGAPK